MKMAAPIELVEYADVERPGVKLVSMKQVQIFQTDTTFGIVFYIMVHATRPNQIKTPPQFQVSITLGSSNPALGLQYVKAFPSQRDFSFVSKVTYPDGTEQVIAKSIDQTSVFPLIDIEGHIHFQVPKTMGQRVFAMNVDLIG